MQLPMMAPRLSLQSLKPLLLWTGQTGRPGLQEAVLEHLLIRKTLPARSLAQETEMEMSILKMLTLNLLEKKEMEQEERNHQNPAPDGLDVLSLHSLLHRTT